jgi:hypothetical protein
MKSTILLLRSATDLKAAIPSPHAMACAQKITVNPVSILLWIKQEDVQIGA